MSKKNQQSKRIEYNDLPDQERNRLYWSATLLVLFGFLFFFLSGWLTTGKVEISMRPQTTNLLFAMSYVLCGLCNMVSGYLRVKYRIPRIKEIDPKQRSSTKGSQLLGGALLVIGFLFLTLGVFNLLHLVTGI